MEIVAYVRTAKSQLGAIEREFLDVVLGEIRMAPNRDREGIQIEQAGAPTPRGKQA